MPQSHTSTEQWQSFEVRMRHRRVQRCLLRASVALDAGVLDDARELCNEAGELEPHNLKVRELAARIAATAESSSIDLPSAPLDLPSAPLDLSSDLSSAPLELDSEPPTKPSRSWRAMVVAAMTVLIAGAAGWFWARSPAEVGKSSVAISDPAVPPSTMTAAQPAAVQVDQTAATVPVTSDDAQADVVPTSGVPGAPDDAGNPEPRATAPPRHDAAVKRTPIAERSVERPTETTTTDGRSLAPVVQPRSAVGDSPAPVAPVAGTPDLALPEPANIDSPAPASPPSGVSAAGLTGTPVDLQNAVLPSAPPAQAPEPSARSGEDKNIRAVLTRYEAAYNRLDASAAATIWPSADRRGLTRAFDGLTAQRVSLGRCDVRITGSTAAATCNGTQRWTPKVGGTQSAPRQWRFDLRNTGDQWVISQVAVR